MFDMDAIITTALVSSSISVLIGVAIGRTWPKNEKDGETE